MKIYFGGSFLPPHLGHHEIIRVLLKQKVVEKLFLVPTFQSPFKEKSGTIFSRFSLSREELIEHWMKDLKELECSEKLILDRRELESQEVNFTVHTLQALQEENEAQDWVLAMGSDLLQSLHQWKKIEDLLSMLQSVWVFPRDLEKDPLSLVSQRLLGLCNFRLMEERVPSLSSTEIREVLWKTPGKIENFKKALPPRIAQLLVERNLSK